MFADMLGTTRPILSRIRSMTVSKWKALLSSEASVAMPQPGWLFMLRPRVRRRSIAA